MHNMIRLSANQTRGLSSSLKVVEKSLLELEDLLLNPDNSCCREILKDIDEETVKSDISTIRKAREHICYLTEKYGTSKEKLSLKRIINAKQSRIWVVLSDALSERIKGYGAFPAGSAGEYDSDIRKLIEITDELRY
jgi:hypothetical protein